MTAPKPPRLVSKAERDALRDDTYPPDAFLSQSFPFLLLDACDYLDEQRERAEADAAALREAMGEAVAFRVFDVLMAALRKHPAGEVLLARHRAELWGLLWTAIGAIEDVRRYCVALEGKSE